MHALGFSIKFLMDRAIEHSIEHSISHAMDYSIEHSIGHAMDYSIDRSIEHSMDHAMEDSIEHPIEHSTGHVMEHSDDCDIEPTCRGTAPSTETHFSSQLISTSASGCEVLTRGRGARFVAVRISDRPHLWNI